MLAGDLRRTLGRERWRSDPVAFVREVLVNPETGQPFELYPAQVQFLREGLTLTSEGKLPCPELVFSAPKKSGKTATAAMATIYVVRVLGGPYAEGYCLANDLEQAQGRVLLHLSRLASHQSLFCSNFFCATSNASCSPPCKRRPFVTTSQRSRHRSQAIARQGSGTRRRGCAYAQRTLRRGSIRTLAVPLPFLSEYYRRPVPNRESWI